MNIKDALIGAAIANKLMPRTVEYAGDEHIDDSGETLQEKIDLLKVYNYWLANTPPPALWKWFIPITLDVFAYRTFKVIAKQQQKRLRKELAFLKEGLEDANG